ncbi:gpW family head-tail joining protein [Saezia sanguinis]|uniref:gpW family head-tail joining protein n=1 Tax=Saezia sanguinis TaxID=1965230 RepID=UPI00305F179F
MVSRTIFIGMSRQQLQELLSKAQQAYIDLMSGNKGVSFSYTQGDGTRSVTYNQASVQDLLALIQLLQVELGLAIGRRAVRFRF